MSFTINKLEGSMLPTAEDFFPALPLFRNLPKPMNYRLVLLPREISTHTKGGIELVEETTASKDLFRTVAVVLAMGDRCYQHPDIQTENPPKVGDWVLVPQHAGWPTMHRGALNGEVKDYRLKVVRDTDVMAIYPNGLEDVVEL